MIAEKLLAIRIYITLKTTNGGRYKIFQLGRGEDLTSMLERIDEETRAITDGAPLFGWQSL